jgi:hypothetical protein
MGQKQTLARLLDHLVRGGEQREWDLFAARLVSARSYERKLAGPAL